MTMKGKYKSDNVEAEGETDGSFGYSITILILAIGAAYLASSLTPGIKGPGWLAFGGVYLLAYIAHFIAKGRR
jgi:hypothetical protein